jgi:ubiquitin C-terminal hydrolase
VTAPASFQMIESNNPDSGASAKEWETFVFSDFSTQIKDHIGQETHSFLTARFSTTTTASMVTSEITLMSTMKNYFSYEKRTKCGIPTLH